MRRDGKVFSDVRGHQITTNATIRRGRSSSYPTYIMDKQLTPKDLHTRIQNARLAQQVLNWLPLLDETTPSPYYPYHPVPAFPNDPTPGILETLGFGQNRSYKSLTKAEKKRFQEILTSVPLELSYSKYYRDVDTALAKLEVQNLKSKSHKGGYGDRPGSTRTLQKSELTRMLKKDDVKFY
ncbi:hypothetical protein HDU76_002832 [Blyttiomyces sp. JEL0837]|nr:hypothetical protein HDU76_002832 [Blyttiomyces sp. JEL0837]